MLWIWLILSALISYLIGSISSAIIVCKWLNLPDPREQGSKNPGATNVYRLAGSKPAALVLIGDWLKGLIPVLTVKLLTNDTSIIAAAFIGTVSGHIFPLFFQFRGGKGVATSFGGLCGVSPIVATYVGLTWLIIAKVFRISSLAAVITAILTPLYSYYFLNKAYLWPLILISILIIWRHKSNIMRLLDGKEQKL